MDELLSQLSPEELEQLIGLGTLDERGDLLSQQLAMAQALRQPRSGNHSTGAGAAFGGLADAVRGLQGAFQSQDILKQQEALLGQKNAGRARFVDAVRRRPAASAMSDEDRLRAALEAANGGISGGLFGLG